jgi:hypothetical protein
MTIILHTTNSNALINKVEKFLSNNYSKHTFEETIDVNNQHIILIIDQNLQNFESSILQHIRESNFILGIWSIGASETYLPKTIKDLLDSLICEENIGFIPDIIKEVKKNIFQHPDCSEIELKQITRVNCRTGKKI